MQNEKKEKEAASYFPFLSLKNSKKLRHKFEKSFQSQDQKMEEADLSYLNIDMEELKSVLPKLATFKWQQP